MKTKLLILIFTLSTFYNAKSQNIYKTENGHIELMSLLKNKAIMAESNHLALLLNYDTKIIKGVLNLKTLSTEVPEINDFLDEQEDPLNLYFEGAIPSVDFLSHRHDPIQFKWVVDVKYQDKFYQSNFDVTITHIEQGLNMSCIFSATGNVLVSETGLESIINGLDKYIKIQFAQMVLKLE